MVELDVCWFWGSLRGRTEKGRSSGVSPQANPSHLECQY